jgi:hypothetical protein
MKSSNNEQKRLSEKIKKLLALSESSNENEALLAAAKAKEMLERYNLSLADIETCEIVEKNYDTGKSRMPGWLLQLGASVARGFNCDIYYRRKEGNGLHGTSKITTNICFVGTDLDTEIAEYVFEYLRKTVESVTAKKMKELKMPKFAQVLRINRTSYLRKMRNSYRIGLVAALDEKIKCFAESGKGQDSAGAADAGNGNAMTVSRGGALQRYMNSLELRRGRRGQTSVLPDGYHDGLKDGKDISINRGLRSKKQPRLFMS